MGTIRRGEWEDLERPTERDLIKCNALLDDFQTTNKKDAEVQQEQVGMLGEI